MTYWRGPRSQEVGEEGDSIYRYTATTRMTPALRWSVIRATLIFINREGQSQKGVVHKGDGFILIIIKIWIKHLRELISAQKAPRKHNNKDRSSLR